MSTGVGDQMAMTVTFSVPNLADRPFVGGGCCALPASQVVADEIRGWPGVETVTVEESGTVSITLQSAEVELTLSSTPWQRWDTPHKSRPAESRKGGSGHEAVHDPPGRPLFRRV